MKVLAALLSSLRGRGQATLAAVYMNTGRLSTLNTAIGKLFKFFITVISAESTTAKITESKQKTVYKSNGNSSVAVNSSYEMSIRGLQYLVELENEGGGAGTGTCMGVGAKDGVEGISSRAGTGAGIATGALTGMGAKEVTGTGTGAGARTGTGAGTGTGRWVSSGSTKGMKKLFERHSPLLLESILPIIIDEKHKKKSIDITDKSNNDNDDDSDNDSDNDDNVLHTKERNNSSEESKNKNRNQNILENNREISFATMEDTDFRILRFLVSSPWGFLGTPHALDSLLNVLLLSCKRMFLNNNQDVLQMEEKLLSYADIMIRLLIPFSYFLYPPSENQKLFYPDNLFNSLENWDEIFKNSKVEKPAAVDDICENILILNLNSDLSMSEEDGTILEAIEDIYNDSKLQSFWPGLLLSSYIEQSKNLINNTSNTNNSNNSNNSNDYSGNTNNSNSDSNDNNGNDEVKSNYNSNTIYEEEKRTNSLLTVISEKLKDILETFLQRSVWLRSTALQACFSIVSFIFITLIFSCLIPFRHCFLLCFIRIGTTSNDFFSAISQNRVDCFYC